MRVILSAFAVVAIATLPAPAFAAEQGAPGQNSTGSVTVTASIAAPSEPIVQITGLDDISFGDVTDQFIGPTTGDGFICIYHTSPTISVEVIPPDFGSFLSNTDPRFADALIPVDLAVISNSTLEILARVAPGASVRGTGIVANQFDPTCATGPSQNISTGILQPTTGATPGVYAGTFQITVAVE